MHDRSYKYQSASNKMYFETDTVNMQDFLFAKLFVVFCGGCFQQLGSNLDITFCIHCLTDLVLYSYDADFIHGILQDRKKKLV